MPIHASLRQEGKSMRRTKCEIWIILADGFKFRPYGPRYFEGSGDNRTLRRHAIAKTREQLGRWVFPDRVAAIVAVDVSGPLE